ncbi:flagellar hook protein FlgE [Verrucomicrobium sp. GAS474]|uniref:flagellar hook-basal body protein n=1 Tax=Verrucomicrobium sp. GAS474 TaxID=1882831 RepID=UPI00087BB9A8|nr:flagellar hook-basal body complex protein [Verrucomicrobium sp. GAS474]SDU24975.1 flagellar hook protein FlgE [Verrucomicrobium sp. GAS474]
MVRSLFSAVSGLVNHQTAMDVIGNNIANVNTTGFKASTAEFGQAFSQNARLANTSTPIGLDIGLGSRIEGTVTDFSQGAFQRTDVPSDVGISGSGMFTVNTASTASAGATVYTRAGNFVTDVNGYLRTSDGYYVQGYTGTGTSLGFNTTLGSTYTAPTAPTGAVAQASLSNIQIPTSMYDSTTGTTLQISGSGFSIGTNGAITVTDSAGTSAIIGYVTLASVQNQNGLSDQGQGYYTTTAASGSASYYAADTGPVGATQAGALELSNADVATQFSNMIVIQRGYDANAKVITTSSQMLQTAVNMVQ